MTMLVVIFLHSYWSLARGTVHYRWCGNQGGNSWEWEFLGISGIPTHFLRIAPPKVGIGIPGNGNSREFPGIPTRVLAFPLKSPPIDTAEKLRVTAFERCIWADLGLRCHQVMDLRFLWIQTQIKPYHLARVVPTRR